MNITDTNFGKLVIELSNFINAINPKIIRDFEGMSEEDLISLSESSSFTGDIAKKYLSLIKMMRVISAPILKEQVNPDVDIPEEEIEEEGNLEQMMLDFIESESEIEEITDEEKPDEE